MKALQKLTGTVTQTGVLYVSAFIVLLMSYVLLPTAQERTEIQTLLVAVVSAYFLAADMIRENGRIKIQNIFALISTYWCVLAILLLVGFGEHPPLRRESNEWFLSSGATVVFGNLGIAIVEELVFRRYLQHFLQKFLSANIAIVVSALAFTFAHSDPSMILFFCGVAYGIMATHLGAIHAAIVVHTTSNVFTTAAFEGGPVGAELSTPLILGGSSALAWVICIPLLFSFMFVRMLLQRRKG